MNTLTIEAALIGLISARADLATANQAVANARLNLTSVEDKLVEAVSKTLTMEPFDFVSTGSGNLSLEVIQVRGWDTIGDITINVTPDGTASFTLSIGSDTRVTTQSLDLIRIVLQEVGHS